MDFSQDKPIRELIGTPVDNSDITLEEFRAILADELSIEEIHARRNAAANKAAFEAAVLAQMIEYKDVPTRKLLNDYRKERYYGGWWSESDTHSHTHTIINEARRRVLGTREHVPTRNKVEGSAERRRLSQQNHGDKKLRAKREKAEKLRRYGRY